MSRKTPQRKEDKKGEQAAQGEQTSSAGQEEYEGEANGLPPPQKSDDEMSVHESDDEELDLLMHRAGHIETAAMGILPGYSTEKKLPMFHRSDLTPAGERDAQTVRFELHPLTHEPHTSQMPGDHGIIDPNSDIYEFRGPLVQVFSMPKKRPLAAMVCNTDVCKFCNPTLGDDYQITTPSRTNGLPFIHTGLDLGQTGLDRDTQTQYSMYDAVPLQSKERMDIAAYSTYIPIHLVQCKVRANWPIWTMTGCVPQECNVCRNLEGKTKVWSSEKKEVTWA